MKIAIIRLSALGDIIQTAIILQFVKAHYKDSKITWFCDKKFSTILENLDEIDEIVSLPLKEKKFLESFKILLKKRNEFDLVIDFQGLIKSGICAFLLGGKKIGFDKFSIRESLASIFYNKKFSCDYNENVCKRYLGLAGFALDFGFSEDEITNKNQIFKFQKSKIELKKGKNILIAAFSSDKSKNYERFEEVIEKLSGYNIYFSQANDDEKLALQKYKNFSNVEILPKISISEIINLIQDFDLIIGNDSAISHLAWAQNKPTITLFGNRPKDRNSFQTNINISLSTGKKIDAFHIDKNDFCISEINPTLISQKAKELING